MSDSKINWDFLNPNDPEQESLKALGEEFKAKFEQFRAEKIEDLKKSAKANKGGEHLARLMLNSLVNNEIIFEALIFICEDRGYEVSKAYTDTLAGTSLFMGTCLSLMNREKKGLTKDKEIEELKKMMGE